MGNSGHFKKWKYHNKRFKEVAEQHGLVVDKSEKYGWSTTTLTQEASDWIQSLNIKMRVLNYSEASFQRLRNKVHLHQEKYVCPGCGSIIRATKEVRVTCTDCELEFEEEI